MKKKLLEKDGFYLALFVCICLVAIGGVWFTKNNVDELTSNDLFVNKTNENSKRDEDEVHLIEKEAEKDDSIPTSTGSKENLEKAKEKQENKSSKLSFLGTKVVREYSEKEPSYSKTLDLWEIHKGLDISADKGYEVKSLLDGKVVNVFKDEAYKNMTKEQKKEIRDKEFKAALRQLGVKEKNIILLSDIDKDSKNRFELMKKIILEFENNLKNVTHISHHYEYDDHPMHIKNGQVLKNLKGEGKVKDALYFMKPQYAKFIPEKNRVIYQVNDMSEYNKVKKACYEYKIVDIENGRYGVGYISAHSYFDNLLKSPNLESILSDK